MAAKKTTKKTAKPKVSKPSFRAPKVGSHDPSEDGAEGEETPSGPPPSLGAIVPQGSLGRSPADIVQGNREFEAAMNKDGRKRVVSADEAPNLYELRRPTGIMSLDIDIGGGFPAGGLSIISGPDNAGKTWLVLRVMAMHQRLYGPSSNLAYTIAEGGFDFKRALQAGLVIAIPDEIINEWNQERLNIGMPPYTQQEILWFKRQIGGFKILRGYTGEEIMHVVLEAVKFNRFGIVAVDSLSILLPEADEAKDVGDTPKRAGNAGLLTDFMKKYTPHTSGLTESNPTSLIGIMQVRANDDIANAGHMAKYMKKWKVTGAYIVKHGKLVDLQIWDGQLLRKAIHGTTQVYGKTLHWRTEKGKAGCHDNVTGETEFRYDIPQGHDDAWGLVTSGINRGVFVEERDGIQVYHPVTREKTALGGYADYSALVRVLNEDFEFNVQMRYFVLAANGVQCLYRPLV